MSITNFDIFNRLGIFIYKDFLSREFCRDYLAEIKSAECVPVKVVQKKEATGTVKILLEPQQRKTEEIAVNSQTKAFVKEKLLKIKPLLEQYFNLSLINCQEPLFYLYRKGDFFEPHRDCSEQANVPEFIRTRRISVVMFLNSVSEQLKRGFYGGGSLTFYGLIDAPEWREYGFPLFGEPGMLVAFRSDTLHEVKSVIHGERYTIVNWFY